MRFWGLALLISCFCVAAVYAVDKHPPEISTVTACGEVEADAVNAKEKAIADALRNALLAGVGAYVQATTLGENYSVVRDEVLMKVSGFATLERVESTSVKDGILRVRVTASVSNVPLAEKLRELGLTREWKVGVYLPETYAGELAPVRTAEDEIIKQLMKCGFRVMDGPQRRRLQRDEAAKRAAEGDPALLAALAREYDVDILVTGEAISEYVDSLEMGGITFHRCRGRIGTRAIYADTGEVITLTSTEADAKDQTRVLALEQCFKNLGSVAGEVLARDLLVAPACMSPFVSVKITGLDGMASAQKVEDMMRALPGVTQVKRHRYTNGVLELNVYVKGEYLEELAGRLETDPVARKMGLEIDLWSKAYIQGRVR